MEEIKLCELFGPTIEGEGKHIGMPFMFLRTSGCNLKCSYCDTSYSWGKETKNYTVEEIKDYIEKSGCNNISITGGEPLYRPEPELENLLELCKGLKEKFIKIETNVTIFREEFLPFVDFWSLSPKLKGMGENTYFEEDVVRQYTDHSVNMQLKFVIGARKENNTMEEDLQSIKDLILRIPKIKTEKIPIILQPEGLTKNMEEYLGRGKMLVERVINSNTTDYDFWKELNLNILPQWHKLLWGDEKNK